MMIKISKLLDISFYFSLFIIYTSLSITNSNNCKHVAKMGYTISYYFLGVGIYGLINSALVLLSICHKTKNLVNLINLIFAFICIIIVPIIIFGSDTMCTKYHTTFLTFTVASWCYSFLYIMCRSFFKKR